MASVSVSHAIMFIASLVVAAAVAGVLVTGVDQIGESIADRSTDTSEDIRTDVTIISDTGSDAIYDAENETVTILVKNTGSMNLVADGSQTDVLINGRFATNVTIESLETDDGTWPTGSVVEITVTDDEGHVNTNGDNRIKVIVNSDEEILRFRA